MDEVEIRKAVEDARRLKPTLSIGLADKYIAAGKSVSDVKSELCERILGTYQPDADEAARSATVAKMAARLGADARAQAAGMSGRPQGVDPKAAVIGNPVNTTAAAPAFTMGQRSMLAVIEREHGKAARTQAEARLAVRVG